MNVPTVVGGMAFVMLALYALHAGAGILLGALFVMLLGITVVANWNANRR